VTHNLSLSSLDVLPTIPAPAPISLDQAAEVDEGRRTSSMTSLYRALLFSLPAEDQQWVLDVVAKHRQAAVEAEARGEPLAGPAW
jgi:hypothetical protein